MGGVDQPADRLDIVVAGLLHDKPADVHATTEDFEKS